MATAQSVFMASQPKGAAVAPSTHAEQRHEISLPYRLALRAAVFSRRTTMSAYQPAKYSSQPFPAAIASMPPALAVATQKEAVTTHTNSVRKLQSQVMFTSSSDQLSLFNTVG